jgi:hypothetical protein
MEKQVLLTAGSSAIDGIEAGFFTAGCSAVGGMEKQLLWTAGCSAVDGME